MKTLQMSSPTNAGPVRYCLQELISVWIIAGSVLASQYRNRLVKSCSPNGFWLRALVCKCVCLCAKGCVAKGQGNGGETNCRMEEMDGISQGEEK